MVMRLGLARRTAQHIEKASLSYEDVVVALRLRLETILEHDARAALREMMAWRSPDLIVRQWTLSGTVYVCKLPVYENGVVEYPGILR